MKHPFLLLLSLLVLLLPSAWAKPVADVGAVKTTLSAPASIAGLTRAVCVQRDFTIVASDSIAEPSDSLHVLQPGVSGSATGLLAAETAPPASVLRSLVGSAGGVRDRLEYALKIGSGSRCLGQLSLGSAESPSFRCSRNQPAAFHPDLQRTAATGA